MSSKQPALISFELDSEELLIIDHNRRVGINTTDPISLLDVRTDNQSDGISVRKTDATKVAELVGLNSDNDNGTLALYEEESKEFNLAQVVAPITRE